MSYLLRDDESLPDGVRRAADAELASAARGLAAGGSARTRSKAVHEARKSLKKVRSLIRLTRGDLPKKLRRSEGEALRAAAARLAAQRDAEVRVETLDALAERAPALPAASVKAVRERLVEARGAARLAAVVDGDVGAPVAATLTDARRRVAAWPLTQDTFQGVADGLERAYQRGRKSWRAVDGKDDAHPEQVHEWRKRAKDLRYHLEFLTGLWPGPLGTLTEELHRLTDLLGDEHDLAVLGAWVSDGPPAPDPRELLAAVDRRRAALRADASALAAQVYAEKPSTFTNRIESYWTAARPR